MGLILKMLHGHGLLEGGVVANSRKSSLYQCASVALLCQGCEWATLGYIGLLSFSCLIRSKGALET